MRKNSKKFEKVHKSTLLSLPNLDLAFKLIKRNPVPQHLKFKDSIKMFVKLLLMSGKTDIVLYRTPQCVLLQIQH